MKGRVWFQEGPGDIYGRQSSTLGHIFLSVLRFSPVSIIPAIHHTHLDLHAALTRKTSRRSKEPPNARSLGNRQCWTKILSPLLTLWRLNVVWTNAHVNRTAQSAQRRRYGVDSRAILNCSSFTCKSKKRHPLQNTKDKQPTGAHPASYFVGTGGAFPRVRRPERDHDLYPVPRLRITGGVPPSPIRLHGTMRQ